MEALPTLMDLLTADLLIPLLPTLVTMATLSLEGVSELVRMVGPGMEQLQPVKVSSATSQQLLHKIITTATTCPDLITPTNGMISYNMGTTGLRPVNTVATLSCNTGFNRATTCQADRMWSGSEITCESTLSTLLHCVTMVFFLSLLCHCKS